MEDPTLPKYHDVVSDKNTYNREPYNEYLIQTNQSYRRGIVQCNTCFLSLIVCLFVCFPVGLLAVLYA